MVQFLRQAERTENRHRAGRLVKGTLEFRRAVELYVSDRATIGTVKGATVNRFSGAKPLNGGRRDGARGQTALKQPG